MSASIALLLAMSKHLRKCEANDDSQFNKILKKSMGPSSNAFLQFFEHMRKSLYKIIERNNLQKLSGFEIVRFFPTSTSPMYWATTKPL